MQKLFFEILSKIQKTIFAQDWVPIKIIKNHINFWNSCLVGVLFFVYFYLHSKVPYLTTPQFWGSLRIDPLDSLGHLICHWEEQGLFGQAVHDYQDGGVSKWRGNCSIKSIDKECHGHLGMGNCCSALCGWCWQAFAHLQVTQDLTNAVTSSCIFGQK